MTKKNQGSLRNIRGIIYDILANTVVFLACYLTFNLLLKRSDVSLGSTLAVFSVYLLLYLLVGMSDGHYDLSSFFYYDRLVKRVTIGCLTSTAFVLFVFYYSGRAQTNKDYYIIYFALCYAAHMLAAVLTYRINRKENSAKRTLLVGSYEGFEKFRYYIAKTSLPFNCVGYIKLEHEEEDDAHTGRYLGYADRGELEKIIREMVVDQVYILQMSKKGDIVRQCTDICVKLGIETKLVFPLERNDCSTHVSSIGTYPVVAYHFNNLNPGMDFIKRVIDIVGAIFGLVLSSPLLLIFGIAIKLDSEGPVFFSQTRVGRNGRRFKIYKLRTMTTDAEKRKKELLSLNEMSGGVMFKIKEDPRVTKIGKFLRKTSIDEIPQFLNVLMGSMSLVGTRPPTEDEVDKYQSEHWRRLRIKPGITGLWQVSGRNAISDFDEIVELDTKYIENWTVFTDIRILLNTVFVVMRRKGSY